MIAPLTGARPLTVSTPAEPPKRAPPPESSFEPGKPKATDPLDGLLAVDIDRSTRAEHLTALADAAAALPAGDARASRVVQRLREALDCEPTYRGARRDRADALGAAFAKLGPHLKDPDVDALLAAVKPQFLFTRTNDPHGDNHSPAAEALGAVAERLPPATLERVKRALVAQLGAGDEGGAAQALGAMAGQLGATEVDALGDALERRVGRERGTSPSTSQQRELQALLRVAELGSVPAAERLASFEPWHALDPAERSRLISVAIRSDAPALKEKVRELLPDGWLANGAVRDAHAAYTQALREKVRAATEGPMHQLGELFTALALAKDPEYQAHVDVAKVQQQIERLSSTEPLAGELARLRVETVSSGSLRAAGEAQTRYLTGADFRARVALSPPDEARALVTAELQKLAVLAPKEVEAVKDTLVGQAAISTFAALARAEQLRAAAAALEQSPLDGLTPQRLADLAARPDDHPRLERLVDSLDRGGRLGTLVTLTRLSGLVGDAAHADAFHALAKTHELLEGAASTASLGRLLRLPATSTASVALKGLTRVVPVANFVGFNLAAIDMARAFKRGDWVSGTCEGVKMGASFTGAMAGVAVITGVAAGPVVLGAALVCIGADIAQGLFADTDEVALLKRLDVYR